MAAVPLRDSSYAQASMSVLILLLPPRSRGAHVAGPAECDWVLSADGVGVQAQGRSAPGGLPRADSVVAVLADGDVAWYRVTLPKAPAARLRQALMGVLEEQLLDDEALHFALAPDATPGRPTWVAVTHRAWLQALLAQWETGGRAIDRVTTPTVPGAGPHGHFMPVPASGDTDALQLSWSDDDGVALLRLAGSFARARVNAALARPDARPRWTATPGAAAAAEAWLGQPVTVLGAAERALLGSRNGWNLRQFDLAPRHRGATALRQVWRRLLGPDWRPVRVGLVALAVVQLLGLNAWAWQEGRALDAKRKAMVTLLKTTFPNVSVVLDAPLQMTRETEALRATAGQPGDNDLETLLAAAAAGWPDDQEPVASLRFEPGRLTLGVPGWDAEQAGALREQLQAAGWAVSLEGQMLTIARAAGAAP